MVELDFGWQQKGSGWPLFADGGPEQKKNQIRRMGGPVWGPDKIL
jgi:hypothetical protein